MSPSKATTRVDSRLILINHSLILHNQPKLAIANIIKKRIPSAGHVHLPAAATVVLIN